MPTETYIETAPSALTEDQASIARSVGLTGLLLVVLGALVLILNAAKARLGVEIGNNVAFAAIVLGMAMMFYHATRDTDQLIRRLYGFVGGLGLALSGAMLSLLPLIISASRPAPEEGTKPIISLFFPFGWACFLAGLFFLMPFCRNETERQQRNYALWGMGLIGLGLALVGFIGGLINAKFAVSYGSVLALLGLAYFVALVSQLGGADLDGYWPALGIGILGLVVIGCALVRSTLIGPYPYFIPAGLGLISIGIAYALTAVFLVSDWEIVVLTRRELLAYFCSPIAYILIFISGLVAWLSYNKFVFLLARGMPEPIVLRYFLGDLNGVLMLLFVVPALTMRLVSEEKRSGTYEVLMCAPVSETPVALSKFLASLVFYMLVWSVWLVFLLDVRVEGDKPFEFRPLISFYLALAASGASFLAMGLFFSSLTRNQIVAAALTFLGMVVWLGVFFIADAAPRDSTRFTILNHLSFVQLWLESLQGRLHLRDLIIQVSIAAFWVFLSVKVLEARRWT